MMLKETIRKIVRSQREDLALFEKGIKRERLKEIEVNIPFAIVLSGVRRCGKSTLLRQIMDNVKGFYFFNFEDPRASGFEINDFEKLDEVFLEEYGEQKYYFFDEIQNAQKWELFVRAILDKKKHAIITGSNASLLSKELGTRLTGRHLNYELFPFSFVEFLKFMNQKPDKKSFEEYFQKGGLPEYLKLSRVEILQELLNDVITRDIVARHGLKNMKIIKDMALFLLTNIGKEFSYNNLRKMFNLGSTNTAVSFVSYLEDSYLLFTVPKFDYSLKKQQVNPKKIYCIDNGLAFVNSSSFSEDKGRLLENIVFINLRKNHKDIFYFREKHECDFIVKDGAKISEAVQVCLELNEENKEREINGILEALKKFELNKGVILTYEQEDELKTEGKTIKILPVWKWLFGK